MKVWGPSTGVIWLVIALMAFSRVRAAPAESNDTEFSAKNIHSNRKDRFLAILNISPDLCTTNNPTNTMGTCLPAKDCTNGGVSSGSCANGFGVCCIIQRTCGSTTKHYNTYFVNNGYPNSDTDTGYCLITVNRASADICQVRLDFIDFELSQPNIDGQCTSDFLTVTGGTAMLPVICGSNAGQHMYVDVDPNGAPLKVAIDHSATSLIARKWNIKIEQISCSSEVRVPDGCLQYFTETAGTIMSFNFQSNIQVGTTPQIADTSYGVCVAMVPGYCGIIWERDTSVGNNSFTVSGNAAALAPGLIGTPDASTVGAANCTTDYIVIPGGVDDNGYSADRYCGLGFPNSVRSTKKPFILFVVTDNNEYLDSASTAGTNSGFSLKYRQTTSCL